MKILSSLRTRLRSQSILLGTALVAMLGAPAAKASIAYGSINNFDTVNDTGVECHGFEIEIDDCQSTDITYTYDYNHYGVCSIRQDDSVAGHPRCVIRWASKKNPDGSWAAYTAVPSGPIAATNGHMFTNPSVNFGGEHFGVGYRVAVGAVRYHWLIDDGAGNLVAGPAVQVSTPEFIYYPPVPGVAEAGEVRAAIEPPEPVEPPEKEFGEPVWVKEIRTTAHNNKKVRLRDLVSDDPADPSDRNWRNGEADEVEVEWELMQTEKGVLNGGKNGRRLAAAEVLGVGDEVITRRYEFYKYVGPMDAVTGEALADSVGPDHVHGSNVQKVNGVEVDYSGEVVVGDYAGAQMAAVDVAGELGLIEHLGAGRVGQPYTPRAMVVMAALPVTTVRTGELPAGMELNVLSGVLTGTPEQSGSYQFRLVATDESGAMVERSYTLLIAGENEDLPPLSLVDTVVSPPGAGTTTGDGPYAPGVQVSLVASASAGFKFLNWTDNGKVVSVNPAYQFTIDVNHSLIANFSVDVPQHSVTLSAVPADGGSVSGAGAYDEGAAVVLGATAAPGYTFTHWSEAGVHVSGSSSYGVTVMQDRALVANFTQLPTSEIVLGASPVEGGATLGGGFYINGDNATVTAVPAAGYFFTSWTLDGAEASSSASYTFAVTAGKSLVANFAAAGVPRTIHTQSSPAAGGYTVGGGIHVSGEMVTVTAVPREGYVFLRWREGGSNVSSSPEYRFRVTRDEDLTAVFDEAFVVRTQASPAVGGTTSTDSTSYHTGQRVRARAVAAKGFQFLNWTESGVVVSTDTSYSFDAAGNRSLVANFIAGSGVTIAARASSGGAGTVVGEGVFVNGQTVTLTAQAGPRHLFRGWTENGVSVSESLVYTFTAGANRTLVAQFLQLPELEIHDDAAHAEDVDVSWPDTAEGWILEESDNLLDWRVCTEPPVDDGGRRHAMMPREGGRRYFRLAHAP